MLEEDKEQQNIDLPGAIEAILFVYGEPMSLERITKIVKDDEKFKKISKKDVSDALAELKNKFNEAGRGLLLISSSSSSGDTVQLATRPEFSPLLASLMKEEFKGNLSPASLETLALIAYLGPLSRARIDYYRGVNSSFILRSLLIRGLIERYPDPVKSNIYLYQASFDLLKYLGIASIDELPEYEKFKGLVKNLQSDDQVL